MVTVALVSLLQSVYNSLDTDVESESTNFRAGLVQTQDDSDPTTYTDHSRRNTLRNSRNNGYRSNPGRAQCR